MNKVYLIYESGGSFEESYYILREGWTDPAIAEERAAKLRTEEEINWNRYREIRGTDWEEFECLPESDKKLWDTYSLREGQSNFSVEEFHVNTTSPYNRK